MNNLFEGIEQLKFTLNDLRKVAGRESFTRFQVYPKRVADRKMNEQSARKETGAMLRINDLLQVMTTAEYSIFCQRIKERNIQNALPNEQPELFDTKKV